jgi:hypothetical protein
MTREIASVRAYSLLESISWPRFSLSCVLSLLFKSLLVNLSLVLIHFFSIGQPVPQFVALYSLFWSFTLPGMSAWLRRAYLLLLILNFSTFLVHLVHFLFWFVFPFQTGALHLISFFYIFPLITVHRKLSSCRPQFAIKSFRVLVFVPFIYYIFTVTGFQPVAPPSSQPASISFT